MMPAPDFDREEIGRRLSASGSREERLELQLQGVWGGPR